MNDNVPKPPAKQSTEPQQWTTANGTPSPAPGVSAVMPTDTSRFEDAAAQLDVTDVALPNPTALDVTMPAMASTPAQIALGVAKTQAAPNYYRAADPNAPLPAGFTFGERYVVERHISSGSFGAVYKASDRAIPNHAVAIKVLHTPAESEAAREQGLRELRLIASVAHPSVVQFKDYGWYEGRLWFAMPWYSGQTLYDRIGGDQEELRVPLSRAEARLIFERLAQGLAAMHAVGIHHHDIKPENVFLANVAGFEGGFPVLLDLGIAAAKGELPAGFTAEYAAPETANTALGVAGFSIGAAADVFSLALTLRNILDPSLIVSADVPSIAILSTRAAQPTPASTRKDLRYLKPSFERWLNLDASARPTPEEFAAELSVLTEPEDRREQRRRAWRRAAPFLFMATVAVGMLGYQLSKEREVVTEQQQVISLQEGKLQEQLSEASRLRQASQQQLATLEATRSEVGDKEAQLKRAIGIAHDLDRQLSRLEQVRQTLSERAERLDGELRAMRAERDSLSQQRNALQSERDGLIAERDGLTQQRNSLRTERDSLVSERAGLRAERDQLIGQVQELTRARTQLEEERDNLRRTADTFLRERETIAAERNDLRATRDNLNMEIARLRAQVDSLEDERTRLRAENNTLRERRVQPSEPAPTVDPGSTTAPSDPDTAAPVERPVRKPRKRDTTTAP